MSSKALENLRSGLAEIDAMQRANPTPQEGGGLTRPDVVRAIGRAEVVLLSSHFERYLYALNEEAASVVLAEQIPASRLPDIIRLLHSKPLIDGLAETAWERRSEKLRSFSADEAKLWIASETVVALDAERLLMWMKTPNCKAVQKLFRIWGIDDVFSAITRKRSNRQDLWLRLGELVEKRNNIAHGDLTVEARYLDIVQYRAAVNKFCERADKQMATALRRMLGCARPW